MKDFSSFELHYSNEVGYVLTRIDSNAFVDWTPYFHVTFIYVMFSLFHQNRTSI